MLNVFKYFKKDIQRIFKTILEIRTLVPTPNFQSFVFLDSFSKRLLKAQFLDLYRNKFYMEYYNFCHQCKDYFATASTKDLSRVSFAATLLQGQVLFCWQQYKRKINGKNAVFITYEEFKIFFCWSQKESQTFISSI